MVESDGLLNRCRLTPYLGFESRSLRFWRAFGGGLLLFACLQVAISSRAQTPANQYVVLRRQSHASRTLRPSEVKADPAAYAGRTFEFRGLYKGTIGEGEDGVQLLIEVPGESIPVLKMSKRPDWLGRNSEVRILCVAAPVPEGEIRAGWPELTLVAIVEASEVDLIERREREADEAARRAVRAAEAAALLKKSARTTKVSAPGDGANLGPPPPRFRDPAGAAPSPGSPSPVPAALSAEARNVFPVYCDYIRNHNRRLTEKQAADITYAILRFSQQWDMDPRLIVATIIAESDFHIQERSHSGAIGLIQLMPDEIQRLKLTNPYDPIQNVMGGIFLLKERLNKYSGSGNFKDASMQHIVLALASYNAGEGAVKKYNGVPPYRETQGYVKRIEALYRELCASDGG